MRTERAFAIELGRGQRRQLQSRSQRKAAAAEGETALDQRREHDDAGHRDALLLLQHPRHLGGTEAAIAFAQDVFRCAAAAVLGEIERDGLGKRLRVAADAVKRLGAIGFGGSAPAGADRIDQHQVGESEQRVRIVLEPHGRRIVAGKVGDARTDDAEVQIGGGGARPAVEREGDGALCAARVLRDESGIEDRAQPLAGLIEQGERSRGRGVGELAARNIDAVLRDRVRRQQPQHAFAARLGVRLVGLVLLGLLRWRPARALLRARDANWIGDQQRQDELESEQQETACAPQFDGARHGAREGGAWEDCRPSNHKASWISRFLDLSILQAPPGAAAPYRLFRCSGNAAAAQVRQARVNARSSRSSGAVGGLWARDRRMSAHPGAHRAKSRTNRPQETKRQPR